MMTRVVMEAIMIKWLLDIRDAMDCGDADDSGYV